MREVLKVDKRANKLVLNIKRVQHLSVFGKGSLESEDSNFHEIILHSIVILTTPRIGQVNLSFESVSVAPIPVFRFTLYINSKFSPDSGQAGMTEEEKNLKSKTCPRLRLGIGN